jgi:hypothetical protein
MIDGIALALHPRAIILISKFAAGARKKLRLLGSESTVSIRQMPDSRLLRMWRHTERYESR